MEDPFLAWAQLPSHYALFCQMAEEGHSKLCEVSSWEDLILLGQGSVFITSVTRHHFHTEPVSNPVVLGIGAPVCGLGVRGKARSVAPALEQQVRYFLAL